MPIKLERNTHFPSSEIPEYISVAPGTDGIPLLGRILIDVGIAIGTIVATVLSGGTALPEIAGGLGTALGTVLPSTVEGAVGLVTALGTNTAIDVTEGHTDALTLGLDIGLPFGTELLSAGISAGIKAVPLGETLSAKVLGNALDKAGLDKITKSTILNTFDKSAGTSINKIGKVAADQARILGKVQVLAAEESTRQGLANLLPKPAINAFGSKEAVDAAVDSLKRAVTTLDQSLKSITDLLDKVSSAAREALLRIIPGLARLSKILKAALKQMQKVLTWVKNPVNKLINELNKRVKPMLKRLIPEESEMKLKLATIKQRADLRKQSILQNSLIAQNNIKTVDSRWVLGYSVVVGSLTDDGEIEMGHLIIWFVPETTAHNGQRGAVPEPMGKRPVTIPNLSGDEIAAIIAQGDWGSYYNNNVSDGKMDTLLGSTITHSESGANWLASLFKNSLSIIPGYSLYTGVMASVSEVQRAMKSAVSGTFGTEYVKQLTNYTSTLHQLGSAYLPKSAKSAAHIVQDAKGGEFSRLLQPAEKQANSFAQSLDKRGTVKHVKSM